MFYRIRFDGWIGGMLRASEVFSSDAESVAWWPAGSTASWVRWGKENGLDPLNAACLALGRTVLSKAEQDHVAAASGFAILNAAINLATHRGSSETLQALTLLYADVEALWEADDIKAPEPAPQGRQRPDDRPSLSANAAKLVEMARLFAGVIEPEFRTKYASLFRFHKATDWTFFVTVACVWRACVGIHRAAPENERTPLESSIRKDLRAWNPAADDAYEHLHRFALDAIEGQFTSMEKAERLVRASSLWVVWNITDNEPFRGEEAAVTALYEMIEAEFHGYWTLSL